MKRTVGLDLNTLDVTPGVYRRDGVFCERLTGNPGPGRDHDLSKEKPEEGVTENIIFLSMNADNDWSAKYGPGGAKATEGSVRI